MAGHLVNKRRIINGVKDWDDWSWNTSKASWYFGMGFQQRLLTLSRDVENRSIFLLITHKFI